MNKKVIVLVGIGAMVFTTLGWGISNVYALKDGNEEIKQTLRLEKNAYILSMRNADMNNDGATDTVVLYGAKQNEEDIFMDTMNTAVIDGKTNAVKKSTLNEFSGYDPKISIYDFTGDGKPDVLLSAASGGSGGYFSNALIDFSRDVATNLMQEDAASGLKMSGKYVDDFKVKMNIPELGKAFTVDVTVNKQDYIDDKFYDKNGKYTGGSDVTVEAYPFAALTPIDFDGDGTYELSGTQRLLGRNNAERISNVTSILNYADGKWNYSSAEYSTYIKQR
jgi:hypothetical protein